jgi:hypothetical protein
MLDHRFSIAPMMDWTDFAEKTKPNQYLGLVAISHVVPKCSTDSEADTQLISNVPV